MTDTTSLLTRADAEAADINAIGSSREIIRELAAALRVSNADAFALSASACQSPAGDEYGNFYCERIVKLERALRRLLRQTEMTDDYEEQPVGTLRSSCEQARKALELLKEEKA